MRTTALHPKTVRSGRRRGLSMIETGLATLIVGLAVLAVVKLVTVVSTQSFYAQKTTTALSLANNVHEYLNTLPLYSSATGIHLGVPTGTAFSAMDDIEDFAGFQPGSGNPTGYMISPPIDANGNALSGMTNWRQEVYIDHVNPSNFALNDSLATDTAVLADRIRVAVSYKVQGTSTWVQVASIVWIKAKS